MDIVTSKEIAQVAMQELLEQFLFAFLNAEFDVNEPEEWTKWIKSWVEEHLKIVPKDEHVPD